MTPPLSSDGTVTIPLGIEVIGSSAFGKCKSIKSATIPASVRKLGGNPFSECKNLESFHVDESNSHYKIESSAILSINGDTLVAFPCTKGGQYEIPSSVRVIGASSFCGNNFIEGVSMNDGIERIYQSAFEGCSNLRDVSFPNTLVFIDAFAFNGDPLANIVIPPSVKTIKIGAFETKEQIESIRIYGTFDQIQNGFFDCDNIRSIYYLSKEPQCNSGDNMDWGIHPRTLKPYGEETPLYVLKETYDSIANGNMSPWSKIENIIIYDPTDDPFLSSVEEVSGDIDPNLPVSVFSLSGVRVADSTDNLPTGIYIVRQGARPRRLL